MSLDDSERDDMGVENPLGIGLDDDNDKASEKERNPHDALTVAAALSCIAGRERFADVFFLCGTGNEQRRVPAHRVILAAASDVFEAMLFPTVFPDDVKGSSGGGGGGGGGGGFGFGGAAAAAAGGGGGGGGAAGGKNCTAKNNSINHSYCLGSVAWTKGAHAWRVTRDQGGTQWLLLGVSRREAHADNSSSSGGFYGMSSANQRFMGGAQAYINSNFMTGPLDVLYDADAGSLAIFNHSNAQRFDMN